MRGYARLGVLNEFLWSSAHKVFKARAFLYAQRLIADDPRSPWGLWHRAYVEALAGLHSTALDDLNEARNLASGKGTPKPPPWVDTLATYCKFDLADLQEDRGIAGEVQAGFLRLLAMEYPHPQRCRPERGQGSAVDRPGLLPGPRRDVQGRRCFQSPCLNNIRARGLDHGYPGEDSRGPPAARERPRADRSQRRRGCPGRGTLEPRGWPGEDTGEPSWAVVGFLIRETRFVLVQHRLDFMTQWWHVPVEEFWNEARSLVARHRFEPYLLTMAIGTPEANQAFADSFDPSWLSDLGYAEQPMLQALGTVSEAQRRPAWSLVQRHMDHLVRDFATQSDLYWKPNEGEPSSNQHREILIHNANKILMLSPENPYAMSHLIEMDWEAVQPRIADWEKKHRDFLPLVGSLGRRYSVLKQYEKGNKFLERYIAESPEHWAYERLAKNFFEQGDITHWLGTLDRYLAAGEDHGLDHAKVRVEIANYYMDKGMWAKAQPYAESAAETWAGWAMQCAVRCYEGMQDWERAEQWVRRLSERYPNSSLRAWLKFCKRTGHGDLAAAQALAAQFGADVGDPAPAEVADRAQPTDPLQAGYSAWLQGSTKEAIDNMRKAYESTSPLLAGCGLMVLSDELGDVAQRDAILNELRDRHRDKAPRMFDVLELFHDSFARGDNELPDLKAVDHAIGDVKLNARGNTEFYVGWLLKKRGKVQDAEAHLQRCIEIRSTNTWLKRIAEATLQRRSGRPVPAKPGPAVPK